MQSIELKSCAECHRRKIRCDKKLPCRACNERGEASLCHRAVIQRSRKPAVPSSEYEEDGVSGLQREMISIRQRLALLEGKLGVGDRRLSRASETGIDNLAVGEEDGLAGVMEDAVFDIGQNLDRQMHVKKQAAKWFEPISLDACLATLPSREVCESLVDEFLEHLNWFCGCLHGPTLKKMHSDFWTQKEQDRAPDGMFIALLFAVLSNTAYLMDGKDIRNVHQDSEALRSQAAVWFNCSYASFFRSEGMSEPCLLGAQAMVTLNYAFHLSGNSRTHGAMFSINIGMARAINLHLLGSLSKTSSATFEQSEIGRRVWWTLVETDWYFTAYKHYAYVTPDSFDTNLPDITDEGDPVSSHPGSLTSLSYLLATCQSARILFDLYGTLAPRQKPSHSSVLRASDQLERISRSFTNLEPRPMSSATHPYMQRIIVMTLHYRLYLIHRTYFVRSLSDPSLIESYKACTTAAQSILDLAEQGLPNGFCRLWNITLWLIAAGLVLSLDLIKASGSGRAPADAPNLRSRLSNLTVFLESKGDTTGIGSRGAKLIRHLCSMENDMMSSAGISLGRMRHQDIVRVVTHEQEQSLEHDIGANVPSMDVAWSDRSFVGTDINSAAGMESTARALNSLMFLQPSWGEHAALDAGQAMHEGSASVTQDYSDFMDFSTDLGDGLNN